MIRALLFTCGIFATVLLLAEGCVVGFLWYRGHLTPQTIREIRLTLSGQQIVEPALAADPAVVKVVSETDVLQARVQRVLELEAREKELTLLKRMTTETANRLISDRAAFDQLRTDFRDELNRLQEQTVSTATEQTRAILVASPPEEAVKRLMPLTTTEGVDLLRGLPEKVDSFRGG